MEFPRDKNFDLFISLLLEGCGLGLLFTPGRFKIDAEFYITGLPVLMGIACLALGLALQAGCVWRFRKRRAMFINGLASIALLQAAGLMAFTGQFVGAVSMLVAGAMQTAVTFMRAGNRLVPFDLMRFGLFLTTFGAGVVLLIEGFQSRQEWHLVMIPLLAAGFFSTAFLGGITIAFPMLRFGFLLNSLQVVPWAVLGVHAILIPGFENLVAPAAIVSMLLLQRFIRWERILIPDSDILSRRMVAIGYVSEIALAVFLGTLLHMLDPFLEIHPFPFWAREGSLLFFLLFSALVYYGTTTVIMTTNGLMEELTRTEDDLPGNDEAPVGRIAAWNSRIERYVQPFMMTPEGIRGRVKADQIAVLDKKLTVEKKRNAQLTLLFELSQQLENHLDQPVSAQLTVNTLERALGCSLVMIFLHDSEAGEFSLSAFFGRQIKLETEGYRQDDAQGVFGRAYRQRKTQIINDVRAEKDFIPFKNENDRSVLAAPLIMNGHIAGIITLHNEKPNAFGSVEINMVEMAAAELTRGWERSGHHHRLMELVQTGSQLTSALDPETTTREVAWSSRAVLQAKFTHIYIQPGQERNFIQQASSGNAPLLRQSIEAAFASLEMADLALRASQPFRIRDVRKFQKTASLKLDNASLRSLLVIPIRWHQVNIGGIFVFGKENGTFFTENDEALAELISIQAAGAFESAWLQQELRSSLRITSLLYRLSNQIIQAENIEDAASDIAQTAHKLARNLSTGIVLLNPDQSVLAEVLINEEGNRVHSEHPMSLIVDAVASGQTIYLSQEQSVMRSCLPIQTPIRSYGAIWMDAHDDPARSSAANPNDLQALVNQAAIALERSLLLVESRRQAKEIKTAYDTLATTYDQTLASLTSALDARDRETEGHSSRVTRLAVRLGKSLGYSPDQVKILERGALLHDIGKIGISDTILHKPGPLTEDEWKIMKLHPDIGARIVEGIPFLEDTITVIRFHQERWDGSGYPSGLKGSGIPELARLFAVVDTFDALTSNRPYRQKISQEEALAYLKEEAGKLFDPEMVVKFEELMRGNAPA